VTVPIALRAGRIDWTEPSQRRPHPFVGFANRGQCP
jgi:hypothetical protein